MPHISFKENHVSLFTFALDLDVEMVNLRAFAQEKTNEIKTQSSEQGDNPEVENTLQLTSLVMRMIHEKVLPAHPSI